MFNKKNFSAAEKKDLVEKAKESAFNYEKTYGNCPQCTMTPIKDIFGGVDEALIKSSFSLGGGTGQMVTGTCGALAGANLIISSVLGRQKPGADPNPKCFQLATALSKKFDEKYGGITCGDVQKHLFGESFDFLIPEEMEGYKNAGGHGKCAEVVSFTCGLISELIVNEELQ